MKKVLIYLSLAVSAMGLAVACGKSDSGGGSSGNTTAATPTSCASGSLYDSRYGCQPIGTCGSNMIYYQNTCQLVQVTNVNQASNCYNPATGLYNGVCAANGYNQNSPWTNSGYTYQGGYFYPTYPQYPTYYNPYYNQNQYGGGGYYSGGIWFRF